MLITILTQRHKRNFKKHSVSKIFPSRWFIIFHFYKRPRRPRDARRGILTIPPQRHKKIKKRSVSKMPSNRWFIIFHFHRRARRRRDAEQVVRHVSIAHKALSN